MEVTWAEIWELFHFALLAALLAGFVCPLLGCFLLVRRTGFYGVALPQFAAAGVSLGYALLPWWISTVGIGGLDLRTALETPHAIETYLLGWASITTLGGIFFLALLGRRRETEAGWVAAGFAVAGAATILLGLSSPVGDEFVHGLLHGELLIVGLHEFETIAAVFGLVLVLFLLFHKDLLLVSYDRETALVLRKNVRAIEVLLAVLVGLTVSVGTLILGPVVLFGLLVLPPLAAHGMARSMGSFYWIASLLGIGSALLGFYASIRVDWPLGPSVVAAAALGLIPGCIGSLRRG